VSESELFCLSEPDLFDSAILFQPIIRELVISPMGIAFPTSDSDNKISPPYLFPSPRSLTIRNEIFCILIIPQLTGRVVARTSTGKFNATGQGDNEEAALQDISEALELLLEEEANPSGDINWPQDYQ